jgi:hypothetical protein
MFQFPIATALAGDAQDVADGVVMVARRRAVLADHPDEAAQLIVEIPDVGERGRRAG